MSIRKLGAALLAVLAIGAVMASSAFAEETPASPTTGVSHWMVNKANLSGSKEVKCSKASATLSLKSKVAGSPVWLTAASVECLAGSKIENIGSGTTSMAVDSGTLRFKGVTVMEPEGCKIAEETITTEPLVTNLEMGSELGRVYDKFAPAAPATRFAVIKLRECAAEGNYNVTGFVRGLSANATGVEAANQKLLFNATSNAVSTLELGGNAATLEGEANNELLNGGEFSATTVDQWSSTVAYVVGDLVESGGVCYEATAAGTNHQPPNASFWKVASSC